MTGQSTGGTTSTRATNGDDRLIGTDKNDTLDGKGGNDHIEGRGGDDLLIGGQGNDTIYGGKGNDTIWGDDPNGTNTSTVSWKNFATKGYAKSGAGTNDGPVNMTMTYSQNGKASSIPVDNYQDQSGLRMYQSGANQTDKVGVHLGGTKPGEPNPVTGVSFSVHDIDKYYSYSKSGFNAQNSFQDVVTIRAYDAQGKSLDVTYTFNGKTMSGHPAVIKGLSPAECTGPLDKQSIAQIDIKGNVSKIEIAFNNGVKGGAHDHAVWVSDMTYHATTDQGGDDLLYGDEGDDVIYGGAGNDTLHGGAGNDYLDGGTGNDKLYGGSGDDTLNGGAGADYLDGGTGMDYVDYRDSDAGVHIDLGKGIAKGGHAEGDTLVGIDGIYGSKFDDTLIGFDNSSTDPNDAYTNVIHGGDGNDYIDGRGGDDVLYGDAGNDTILGGAGNDYLDGGDGDDLLIGGEGCDTMHGGDGNDTLIIGRGDHAYGGNGNDRFILDDDVDNCEGIDKPIFVDGGDNDPVTKDNPGDVLDLSGAKGWKNYPSKKHPGSGVVVLKDGTQIHYKNIEQVICLTPGALILTTAGLRPVETLREGDMVVTRDSGPQAIRWIGRSTVAGQGDFAPIRLRKGSVAGLTQDLLVSPQHRMLVQSFRSELMFGAREVLTAAKHMVDGTRAVVEEVEEVTYIHMIFDRHEVIFANGAPTESFHPASYSLGGLAEATREELFAVFPDLRSMPDSYGQSARRILKAYEAKAFLAA